MKERKFNNDTRKNIIVGAILLFAFVLFILPFVKDVLLSIPGSDDFPSAIVFDRNGEETLLAASARNATENYFHWAGGWIYMFLETFINPLLIFSVPERYMGWEMLLFFLTFSASLLFLLHTLMVFVLDINERIAKWTAIFFIFFVIFNGELYTEVFNWFVGSSYAWGASFAYLTLALIMRDYFNGNNVVNDCFLLLFGILACNGITSDMMVGFTYLVFIILDRKKTGKWNVKSLCFLGLFVLVGCLTVFSPGSMTRYSSYNGDVGDADYLWAVKHTLLTGFNEGLRLIKIPSVAGGLLVLFVLGGCRQKGTKRPGLVSVLSISIGAVSCFGVLFPISFGYYYGYLTNRYQFAFDVPFLISVAMVLYELGVMIKGEKRKKTVSLITVIASGILLIAGVKNSPWSRIVKNLDDARTESKAYWSIYSEIEKSSESDVIIRIQGKNIPESGIIALPSITGDPNNYVDASIAKYYGKNSVKFEWID